MRRRDLIEYLLFIALLAFSVLIWGCNDQSERTSSPEQGKTQRAGGTYRLPLTQNPASLDPAYVHHNYGNIVVQQMFDGLVRFDAYLAPIPALAESWRIEDNGLTYIFTLRRNARFHNGLPVTVEDVIYSLSRLLRIKPPPAIEPHLLKIEGAAAYREFRADRVTGFEVSGQNILRVRLVEPHVPFLTALGMYQAAIVPRMEFSGTDKFHRNPIGSGPFRFVSWEKDRSIRLERFEDYYEGNSLLEAIEFKIFTQQQNKLILMDFRQGRLHEMPVFSPETKAALAEYPGLQWFHRPSLSLFFYGINCEHPPLNDPVLRRYLSAAIDRRELVDKVFNGQFETAQTILPPGMPGYNPPSKSMRDRLLESIPQPNRALDGDGIAEEIEIVSAYETPRVRSEMELVGKYWRKLGVRLKAKYITDWDAFNDYIRSDKVQIYRYVWYADMPDPDSMLYPLFASDSADNQMRFHDSQVDRLLNAARRKIDPVERTGLYREAEKLILSHAPLIPLFHLSVDRVYQAAVMGARPSALGAHTMSLHKVWLNRNP